MSLQVGRRVAPDCDECEREAAVELDGRTLCGTHAIGRLR